MASSSAWFNRHLCSTLHFKFSFPVNSGTNLLSMIVFLNRVRYWAYLVYVCLEGRVCELTYAVVFVKADFAVTTPSGFWRWQWGRRWRGGREDGRENLAEQVGDVRWLNLFRQMRRLQEKPANQSQIYIASGLHFCGIRSLTWLTWGPGFDILPLGRRLSSWKQPGQSGSYHRH